MGARVGPPRVRGLALALVLLAALVVPSAASATRTEFYGIVQTATLDDQDIQGMLAARVRTTRFVLKWGSVPARQGLAYRWKSSDDFIGALARHGIRSVPSVWGNPRLAPGSGSTPPLGGNEAQNQWRALLRALVSRYGPGGAYWKGPYQNRYGTHAKPLPIQSWEIWNEPNLRKYFAPYPSPGRSTRSSCQISSRRDQEHGPRTRRSCSPACPAMGTSTAWDFLAHLLRGARDQGFFDAVALHPYAPRPRPQFKTEIQRVRDVMRATRRRLDPAMDHRDRVGLGAAGRYGINKGLTGQAHC